MKRQIKAMKTESYDTQKRCRDLEDELKQTEQEKEDAVKELAELKSMISPVDDTEKTVSFNVDFPYSPNLRHVVFGGHSNWLKNIRYLLPDVRFIDPDTKPDLRLIEKADVVWFQSNVISHCFFNMVLDKCRQLNVDYQYFGFVSAEKCAEQLALYDMKKVEEETV